MTNEKPHPHWTLRAKIAHDRLMTDLIERFRSRLESIDGVASVAFVDGENDYIAGQRDIDRFDFDVTLDGETTEQIEEEWDEDGSDTLRGITNEIELEMGMSPGPHWLVESEEFDRGVMAVQAEYDQRPGGSGVGRTIRGP